MHCLFGYGSLICTHSRSRTGVSGDAFPVELTGITRRWSVPVPSYQATAVGAHEDPEGRCNGVVFMVDEDNLARFDEREQGYRRIAVPWHRVTPSTDLPLPTALPLWAYVGHNKHEPLPGRPIMQSYLDVILNGCLTYGETFARQFLRTTAPWQHLVDDRPHPNYPRAMNNPELPPRVDALLASELPELLAGRTLFQQ